MELEKFSYDNKIVKQFSYATLIWGLTGMLVGLIVALQMAYPEFFNEYLGFSFLSFGRLRPLHTNAVIFAFVGNGIFAGVYYSLQRLLKTRMFNDTLSKINFWGWQLIIVCAALTLPLGYTTGKEYAELEWWIDILIALIWVVFGWNMIGTIIKRRVQHMYVAIWFYIATFITVAMLHIFNSFELPIAFMKSYSWYAGVEDALVQWWYGHNAVAFFLTTPYLGLMYYFVPKAVNRPVYSYKLSIIHFWALIFIYIWAGPHHLLYTALPDWAQNLGVVFSVMLVMPSWGGMLNGLLTMRGAWDRVRDSAVLKFMVVAITCYGMSTFEGPLMSLPFVNELSHFTDWTIGHVHIGGLGWNGMMTFGMMYYIFPKIFRTKLFSEKLANIHFWIATLGIVFYALPMYWAGFTQGFMWQEFNPDGTLVHGFLETVTQLKYMYAMRALGGLMFLGGAAVGVYNLFKTAGAGNLLPNEEAEAMARVKSSRFSNEYWHNILERKPVVFTVLVLVAVAIGGLIQVVPISKVESNIEPLVEPYSALELEGRDIYIREGCYTCHSQMIRPLRFETKRYGDYSKAGEFVYDHPFQWGSKRTGPDLAREGSGKLKKSDSWHYTHFRRPVDKSTGSVMPAYPWLIDDDMDLSLTDKKIAAMRTMDVPYAEGYEVAPEGGESPAMVELRAEAEVIATNIVNDLESKASDADKQAKIDELKNKEVIAIIAYLQKLGADISVSENQ